VKMNGVQVWNVFRSPWDGNCRGMNILEIDPFTCTKKTLRHFDIFGWKGADGLLRDYLKKLVNGSVIVGVAVDEPRKRLTGRLGPAPPNFKEFGMYVAIADVQPRGSFVFIAQKSYPSKALLRNTLTLTDKQPAQLNAIITGMPVENFVRTCLNKLHVLALIPMADI